MWKAEEGLNLRQLRQWVVDKLVAIDDVQLLFGEELVKNVKELAKLSQFKIQIFQLSLSFSP